MPWGDSAGAASSSEVISLIFVNLFFLGIEARAFSGFLRVWLVFSWFYCVLLLFCTCVFGLHETRRCAAGVCSSPKNRREEKK